jgi:hypothetical protein
MKTKLKAPSESGSELQQFWSQFNESVSAVIYGQSINQGTIWYFVIWLLNAF